MGFGLQAEALQRGTHPDVHVRLSGQDCEEEPSINDMLWS